MLYDKDIREPLFDYLEERFGKSRILEEKRTGRSRADVVLVLPALVVGIEIKSDADSYTRLKSQTKDYDKYYDRNILVVGSTHAMHAAEHVPEYWGILSVEEQEDGIDFYMVREAKDNPKREIANKITLLWRPELAHIQEIMGMAAYKRESKAFVTAKILEKVPEDELSRLISDELFERDYNIIAQTISDFREEIGRKPKVAKRRRRRRRK